jgi:hypothetical protein
MVWLLLSGQLFRRIVELPGFGGNYLAYLTPGVVVMTAMMSAGWSGTAIVQDMEREVMDRLVLEFAHSEKLQRHVQFLFSTGGMYLRCNGNLLYHGCIPMYDDGSFAPIPVTGSGSAMIRSRPAQDITKSLWPIRASGWSSRPPGASAYTAIPFRMVLTGICFWTWTMVSTITTAKRFGRKSGS